MTRLLSLALAALAALAPAARGQSSLPLTMCTCGGGGQRLLLGTNLSLIRAGAEHDGLCLTAGALGGACQGACVSLAACASATLWNLSGSSASALVILAATGAPGVAGLRLSGPVQQERFVVVHTVNSGAVNPAAQVWDASQADGGLRSSQSASVCVSTQADCLCAIVELGEDKPIAKPPAQD
jgi:hypothetical protein